MIDSEIGMIDRGYAFLIWADGWSQTLQAPAIMSEAGTQTPPLLVRKVGWL